MEEIILTQNKVALIDDEDYDLIKKYKWCTSNYHGHYYAATEVNNRTIKMHRLILNVPEYLDVDHIDNNGLNNQKSNIRICTASQNAMNTKKHSDARSKYKGVWICKDGKTFRIRAGIRVNNKLINLGTFKNEEQAARAYDDAAIKYFGEFANINFK